MCVYGICWEEYITRIYTYLMYMHTRILMCIIIQQVNIYLFSLTELYFEMRASVSAIAISWNIFTDTITAGLNVHDDDAELNSIAEARSLYDTKPVYIKRTLHTRIYKIYIRSQFIYIRFATKKKDWSHICYILCSARDTYALQNKIASAATECARSDHIAARIICSIRSSAFIFMSYIASG